MQLFPVRSGRLDERRSMYLENIGESPPGELLVSFLAEYYAQQVGVPPLVVVPVELDDQDVLEEYLSERRGSRVEVRVAGREPLSGIATAIDDEGALLVRTDAGVERAIAGDVRLA